MSRTHGQCFDVSLKLASTGGVSHLVEAAGRRMNACGVCDTTVDSVGSLMGEVIVDILMNGYPDRQGYLALSCAYQKGTVALRITDHGIPRNIFEETDNPVAGIIRAEMDESSYTSAAGENILQMTKTDVRNR
ncbi:ATP-binding protein [Methanogenium sp. S4BF]|uniref:hypothetical protein n=1 Tax=Methanogenium sp. S4BF TaxID=1789226 RepID=UPI002415A6C4|nr:hypothetical protein [Methanogenium sp. S4BF]WFN34478.1 ATP-binding protein [Methanogenium sp. S4BF]